MKKRMSINVLVIQKIVAVVIIFNFLQPISARAAKGFLGLYASKEEIAAADERRRKRNLPGGSFKEKAAQINSRGDLVEDLLRCGVKLTQEEFLGLYNMETIPPGYIDELKARAGLKDGKIEQGNPVKSSVSNNRKQETRKQVNKNLPSVKINPKDEQMRLELEELFANRKEIEKVVFNPPYTQFHDRYISIMRTRYGICEETLDRLKFIQQHRNEPHLWVFPGEEQVFEGPTQTVQKVQQGFKAAKKAGYQQCPSTQYVSNEEAHFYPEGMFDDSDNDDEYAFDQTPVVEQERIEGLGNWTPPANVEVERVKISRSPLQKLTHGIGKVFKKLF